MRRDRRDLGPVPVAIRRSRREQSDKQSDKGWQIMRLYRIVIGLIAGLGLLVVGALALSDTAVKCGSKVMRPGTVCATTRKGVTTERSYDQQRSYNRRIGVFSTGGGLVVTVVCGALLAGAVRRRRADAAPMARPSGQQ